MIDFYRGLLQAVKQVMMLALKRRRGRLLHYGLCCLLAGLGKHKEISADEQVQAH